MKVTATWVICILNNNSDKKRLLGMLNIFNV